jgi:hypothetical protein
MGMLRRLTWLTALALLAGLLLPHAAGAEPRVGPPLDVQLYSYDYGDGGAYLSVGGRGCLPQDGPASVLVTLDRAPGEVFTAEPDARGRWYVEVKVDTPVDGVYLVNATCDNYFGTTVYPEARTDADQIIYVAVDASAGGGPRNTDGIPPYVYKGDQDLSGELAHTGNRAATELAVGFAAVVAGVLLLWAGRARRPIGRHRVRLAP